MILDNNINDVYTSGVSGTEQFKFSNSPIIFKILSDSLYSDKITSIVRELASNARDAHIAAGKSDVPFEIHLPVESKMFDTSDSKVFSIKDYGVGLSEEEIYNLYTIYGESNKRSSNDFIGGFGIGSKSPFAYTETFNIISRYNGVKTTYSAFINADGFPSITKVFSVETDEENGVEISFRVKDNDIYHFVKAVGNELMFFNPYPVVNSSDCKPFDYDVIMEGKDWFVNQSRWRSNSVKALIGDIPYTIDSKDFYHIAFHTNGVFYIKFNVGDLDLSASRESIAYTEKTKNAINKRIEEIKDDIIRIIEKNIEGKSLYDKISYVNDIPFSLLGTLKNKKGYDDLVKCKDCIHISADTMKEIQNRKCGIRLWSVNKWRKANGGYEFLPHKNMNVYYIPAKYTLENVANYLKQHKEVKSAVVVRYHREEDIPYLSDIIGNPSVFVKNPIITSIEKKTTSSEVVHYRRFEMYSGAYISVKSGETIKTDVKKLKEVISKARFVLLYEGNYFKGGEDWTQGHTGDFIGRLNKFCRRANYNHFAKFGDIILLSKTAYARMKKHGVKITSYNECVKYIEDFVKDNFEFKELYDYAKFFTPDVRKVINLIVRTFTKYECQQYKENNCLFDMAYNLYDIIIDGGKSNLFYEYSENILDNSLENGYDTTIENEPILKLFSKNNYFADPEIKNCFIHYLNLN